MDEATIDGIAKGYAVANLWTAGIDEMQGEYQPDEDKVTALMPYAREAAAAFVHIVGEWSIDTPEMGLERIGHCLHYEREGCGIGFTDDGDSYPLSKFSKVARMMGEDSVMQGEILDRWPSEAFA